MSRKSKVSTLPRRKVPMPPNPNSALIAALGLGVSDHITRFNGIIYGFEEL